MHSCGINGIFVSGVVIGWLTSFLRLHAARDNDWIHLCTRDKQGNVLLSSSMSWLHKRRPAKRDGP